jgi:phosphotransferase system enzyme I (PtsP)
MNSREEPTPEYTPTMLDRLRRVTQEVMSAPNLEEALSLIVTRVRAALGVDVVSVYLCDAGEGEGSDRLVLAASEGLNPDSVGRVALPFGEGLVGFIAERAEPLNLENAADHPAYRYFRITGEERFRGFLGVPVIHRRRLLGVLVAQQRTARRFRRDDTAFLATLAAQVGSAIAQAEAARAAHPARQAEPRAQRGIKGLAAAPGVGIGQIAVVYSESELEGVSDQTVDNVEQELERFRRALSEVREEFRTIGEQFRYTLPDGERALFEAYTMILDSDSLTRSIESWIRAGHWAPGALRRTIEEHCRVFAEMSDPYLSQRSEDIRDLGRRILQRLRGDRHEARSYPPQTILVGHSISASDLATVPVERLTAVASRSGSSSSHVAILCRALGVPAIMGASELPLDGIDHAPAVVDGYRGRFFIYPAETILGEYQRLVADEERLSEELQAICREDSVTIDGTRISLQVNTGLLAEVHASDHCGADGVGLYRTEIPFQAGQYFPSEDDQTELYARVLDLFRPLPVVCRTLDVGGDKPLPYFPIEEDNPFLGWRGIRLALDQPEVFLSQLRALLRANEGRENLKLLLPMISGVPELDDALTLIHRAHRELTAEGHTIPHPPIGIMIEVPSTLFQLDALSRRVDFVSIGTNDLTQYLLAVDRNNEQVAKLYDALHPAVLRAIRTVVQGGRTAGRPVSVCGELAGDPLGALVLVGLGITDLSMNLRNLPRVKWVIRSFSRAETEAIAEQALQQEDAGQVHTLLVHTVQDKGLGRLVRLTS